MIVSEGLIFPMKDKDWTKKVLIGGLLNLVPIVSLISLGYSLVTMKMVINGNYKLPEWEDFEDMFIKGLIATIISLIYLIIPIIVMFMVLHIGKDGFSIITIEKMAIFYLLMAIFGFLLPMILANYVAKDSVGAAFEFGEIISRVKSVIGDYIVCYVVFVTLYFIVGVISIIPIIGWIVSAFLLFYIQLVYAYYSGILYAKSTP